MLPSHDRLSLLRLRATLADTLCLIDDGLPGAARVALPSAVDDKATDLEAGRVRRRHLPSDFAKIGGRDLRAEHTSAFTSPWWADAYRPGATCEMFVTCCYGQKRLGKLLDVPAYHVGICDAGGAWKRVNAMKRRSYGAGHYSEGRYVEDEDWTEWFLGRMSEAVRPSPGSPVTVAERGLVVRLPDGYDVGELEAHVMAKVRKGSLAAWLRSEEGQNHCRWFGVDPALGQRHTMAPIGSGGAPEPVEDIAMRSQRDIQARLIHIVERAVLAHLRARCPETA